MAAKKDPTVGPELHIAQINVSTSTFPILFRTPFLHNSLTVKGKRDFLLPAGRRRTAADRAASLKHDAYAEFRDSAYTFDDPLSPTLLGIRANAFKSAMCTAALDLPGTKKTEIGRLCWVTGNLLPQWGIPKLYMAPVRSADMNRTPDIRIRCICATWATEVSVEYVVPRLSAAAIINLLYAAGYLCGVGDGRQEKGKLNFGQFQFVTPNTPEWDTYQMIKETGGRAAQVKAMKEAEPYDVETAELLSWYSAELERRGHQPPVDDDDDLADAAD